MNHIEKIIYEDLVNYQSSNTAPSGNTWHNRQNPSRVSIIDILKVDRSEMTKSSNVLPFQIQTVPERLIHLQEETDDVKNDFIKAYSNEMIREDEQKKAKIKSMVSDLNKISRLYTEIFKKLDSFKY